MNETLVLLPPAVEPGRLVRSAGEGRHALSGASMGTHWSLDLSGDADPQALEALIEAELGAVIREMSQWEPESEISRFNRAEAGSWRELSLGFFHVLRAGLAMARATGGAFDPTLGAVVDLWGFGPVAVKHFPPLPEELEQARAQSGWEKIELDEVNRRACQPGGLQLDFSGIAKGHALDRVARALEQAGYRSFLFELGGELIARGLKPDAFPWWVELELPPGAELAPIRVGLLDLAIATSGDYRRYVDMDGRRMAHSIDPRSGAPLVDAPAAVTVLHSECMIADALATAIMVLGREAGMALAERAQVAAIVTERDGQGWQRTLSSYARMMAES
ncbi:FAD:protein FMN transferase [Altererythrobacter sp. CC-YST694]|uniref:FAD:protein FMN transferase n=1 Tax=Altererythrobacter sp. CC-YST694 TaxID=2755038 RepID=UPI001D00C0A7|nr:FAD:protein FMN transferase [Altererythrobacter sp. CC-YST694]MCB5425129.1 FAD:protein FMN transferase [Altererythrobacter sp. CC-YST694]